MLDSKIQELLDAYLQHELDFDEYRRLRTDYIDSLNGTQHAAATRDAATEVSDDTDQPPETTLLARVQFRHNQIALLGAIVALALIIVITLFQ